MLFQHCLFFLLQQVKQFLEGLQRCSSCCSSQLLLDSVNCSVHPCSYPYAQNLNLHIHLVCRQQTDLRREMSSPSPFLAKFKSLSVFFFLSPNGISASRFLGVNEKCASLTQPAMTARYYCDEHLKECLDHWNVQAYCNYPCNFLAFTPSVLL